MRKCCPTIIIVCMCVCMLWAHLKTSIFILTQSPIYQKNDIETAILIEHLSIATVTYHFLSGI